MKKVFIDCGAHDGCSVRKFLDVMEDSGEYEIHSFEPNPNLEKYHPVQPAIFHKQAVWIEDGEITFYNFSTTGGSSVLKAKHNRNIMKTTKKPLWMKNFGLPEAITVSAIDFSSWVTANFNKDDYIIVKMDIEGAEYEILKKMFLENTISYINEFWVEWHFTNQPRYYNMAESLSKLILQRGIKLVQWDAMHSPYLIETNCSESPEFGKE
tara:strand:- start:1154 stop:1783 length:630 start_codon:yes stop_codon:yes gene_type:complete